MAIHSTLIVLLAVLCIAEPLFPQLFSPDSVTSDFTRLREKLNIPGITIAAMKDGKLILSEAIGYNDLETREAMTVNTVIHTASITKTFVAYVMGKLHDERKLSLRDEVSKYNLNLGTGVLVEHLLSHTSLGEPGKFFYYHSGRFNKLDTIIYQSTGRYLASHITEKIIDKIPLRNTFPNPYDTSDFRLYSQESFQKYRDRLYSGYIHDSVNLPVNTEIEKAFAASAGLLSTAEDLVTYGNYLLTDDSARKVFNSLTNIRYSPEGNPFPYALGWFVEYIDSVKFTWHYGYMGTNSSLLILVPEQSLSFAILANSNNLSRIYPLEEGSYTASEAGLLFLKHFMPSIHNGAFADYSVSGTLTGQSPLITRITKYLNYSKYRLNKYQGKFDSSFSSHLPLDYSPEITVALLSAEADNLESSVKFSLMEKTKVRFISAGEGFLGSLSDYGYCTDTTGRIIWDMRANQTISGGGNVKNQKAVSQVITLHPGNYWLNFVTDESHSPEFWTNYPPDDPFWGIYVISQK